MLASVFGLRRLIKKEVSLYSVIYNQVCSLIDNLQQYLINIHMVSITRYLSIQKYTVI